jgi:hypothetical protein
MAGKRAGTLRVLMERIEAFTLHRAWTQLSDEEFFWEARSGRVGHSATRGLSNPLAVRQQPLGG